MIALSVLAACSTGTASKKVADQGTAPTSTTPGQTPAGADVTASQGGPGAVATPSQAASRAATASKPAGGSTATRPAERLTSGSRLRVDGIGPITVGMSLSQASAAAGTPVRITSADFGSGCRYAAAANGPAGLSFMVIGGRIVRIDVGVRPDQPPPTIATLSGIRIGSTENEVKVAYPGRISVTGNPYLQTGHYLTFTPANRAFSLIFETDGGRVTSFRSGQAGPVSAIEGCL